MAVLRRIWLVLESVSMNGPFVNMRNRVQGVGMDPFCLLLTRALFLVEGADHCLNMIGWLWPACIASDLMAICAFHII